MLLISWILDNTHCPHRTFTAITPIWTRSSYIQYQSRLSRYTCQGVHTWNKYIIGYEINYLQYIFASELLYVITMAITKVAIGVYFLRLANKLYQFWIIYSVMALALSVSSAYFIFVLLQCQPISYFWNMFGDGTGTCLSTSTRANVTYAHAAMSAVTDWAYGTLPITFVWKVKMNPRTKLSVVLILSLGFL